MHIFCLRFGPIPLSQEQRHGKAPREWNRQEDASETHLGGVKQAIIEEMSESFLMCLQVSAAVIGVFVYSLVCVIGRILR